MNILHIAIATWWFWLPALLVFAVTLRWPGWHHHARRILFMVLFGIPFMFVGFIFGYIQAGFLTGYMLYNKFDRDGGK